MTLSSIKSDKFLAQWRNCLFFGAAPTLDDTRINFKQIQHSSQTVINQVINGLWVIIERGHRRHDMYSHLCGLVK